MERFLENLARVCIAEFPGSIQSFKTTLTSESLMRMPVQS
jgi:hypothetical protein